MCSQGSGGRGMENILYIYVCDVYGINPVSNYGVIMSVVFVNLS